MWHYNILRDNTNDDVSDYYIQQNRFHFQMKLELADFEILHKNAVTRAFKTWPEQVLYTKDYSLKNWSWLVTFKWTWYLFLMSSIQHESKQATFFTVVLGTQN